MFTIRLGDKKLSEKDTKDMVKDLLGKPQSKKELENLLKFLNLNEHKDIIKNKKRK